MIAQRVESWGPWFAAIAVSLGFLVLVAGGTYSLHQQRTVNHKLCQQTVDNRAATRTTWEAARSFITARGGDQRATNEFFNAILETIPPLECIDNKPVAKEG